MTTHHESRDISTAMNAAAQIREGLLRSLDVASIRVASSVADSIMWRVAICHMAMHVTIMDACDMRRENGGAF
jgi:hypothetical protein